MKSSKQYFWYAAIAMFLINSTSIFWGDFGPLTVFEMFMLFLVCPLMGLWPVYGYAKGKRIGVGLISAEPGENGKQLIVLLMAVFLLWLPIYYLAHV